MIVRNHSWYYVFIGAWALTMGLLGTWLVDRAAKYHFSAFGYFYIGCVSVALWLMIGFLYRKRGFNAWTCIALGLFSPLVGSVAVSFFAFLDVIFYCWVFFPIGLCTAFGIRLIWRFTLSDVSDGDQ